MTNPITVYAVSDMTGETVARLVRAASAQFPQGHVTIKVLQHVGSARQVVDFVETQRDAGPVAVFHTILSKRMREDLRTALQTMRIPSIDLLGSAAHVISDLLDERPQETPGLTIDDGAEPTVRVRSFGLSNPAVLCFLSILTHTNPSCGGKDLANRDRDEPLRRSSAADRPDRKSLFVRRLLERNLTFRVQLGRTHESTVFEQPVTPDASRKVKASVERGVLCAGLPETAC